MATDVFDEHRFSSQAPRYEPSRTRFPKEPIRRPLTSSATNIFETTSPPAATRPQRIKYSTQTSAPTNSVTTNSINQRHSVSNDLMSLFRSFAIKPFRATSMTNAAAEGQTNNIISGNHIHTKPPVSLLKYRPLSENVSDHTSYAQPTRVCISNACVCRLQKKLLIFMVVVKSKIDIKLIF
jgi:hypothetical protein